MSLDIPTYLQSNEFVEHPMGDYACYGVNNFGCDSVIRYNDKLYKFWAFQYSDTNCVYIGIDGERIVIKPYQCTNITRMIAKTELPKLLESMKELNLLHMIK